MYISIYIVAGGQVPLSQLFQKPPDTWECPTCMITNKDTASMCIACSCPKTTADHDVPTVIVDFVILPMLNISHCIYFHAHIELDISALMLVNQHIYVDNIKQVVGID